MRKILISLVFAFIIFTGPIIGEVTVPPGVPKSMRTLTSFVAHMLKAEVGYGGVLQALHVYGGPGVWHMISTPSDVRPLAQSEDGMSQICGAAAIDINRRSIVQQAAATAIKYGSTWLPQNSKVVQMDSLGGVGQVPWRSWWELYDSEKGDKTASPLWIDQTISMQNSNEGGAARGWVNIDATVHRMSGLPEFTYERWNVPYIVLDGTKINSIEIDGVRTSISQVPVGSTKNPPALHYPVGTPTVRIGTTAAVGGRTLVIRGSAWTSVRYWRPHSQVFIISGIVSNLPCTPGAPVQLHYEIEVQ